MLEIGLSLVEGGDGELLRRSAATKTGDLREDKPDPVTRLSPSTEFSEDCVVGGLLCVEKAVEIVTVGHGTCL